MNVPRGKFANVWVEAIDADGAKTFVPPPSGRHLIDSSTHIFERFFSVKQQRIQLTMTDTTHHKDTQSMATQDEGVNFLVCETKDLIKVGVRVTVSHSIEDPAKCVWTIGADLVQETAVATLTNVIRSTALDQIAQSEQMMQANKPALSFVTVTNVKKAMIPKPEEIIANLNTTLGLFRLCRWAMWCERLPNWWENMQFFPCDQSRSKPSPLHCLRAGDWQLQCQGLRIVWTANS